MTLPRGDQERTCCSGRRLAMAAGKRLHAYVHRLPEALCPERPHWRTSPGKHEDPAIHWPLNAYSLSSEYHRFKPCEVCLAVGAICVSGMPFTSRGEHGRGGIAFAFSTSSCASNLRLSLVARLLHCLQAHR